MVKRQSENLNNEILWDRLREGNQKAIEELYHLNYQVLYSYAFKICRDKELSKDCVQDLFVQLWEKKKNLNEVAKVRSYLIQSIWHILIKKLKKTNRSLSLDESSHYESDVIFSREHILINNQSKEDKKVKLTAAIQNLSKHQREIIFMQYYEGLTISEIQQAMSLIGNLIHQVSNGL